MDFNTVIGVIASVLTGSALVPQLVKLIQEKKPGDISFVMLIILFSGLAFWTYYGILKEDWIIIVSNSFSLIVNACIVTMSYVYKKQKARPSKNRRRKNTP